MLSNKITFITFTKNSGKRLEELLKHIHDIVDEIIVVDGCSTDDTVEIALSYGAKVFRRKPKGYVEPDRMFALSKATHDWVLYLDDDERLSKNLKKDLRTLIERYREKYQAYYTLRYEMARRKIPCLSTWQIRVFNKNYVQYKGIVHELPEVLGSLAYMNPSKYFIIHKPKYFETPFRKSSLPIYAWLESLQYPSLRFLRNSKSQIRRALIKALPLTSAVYIAYRLIQEITTRGKIIRDYVIPCIDLERFDKCVHTYTAIPSSCVMPILKLILYEVYTGALYKLRSKTRAKVAEYIFRRGMIEILEAKIEDQSC